MKFNTVKTAVFLVVLFLLGCPKTDHEEELQRPPGKAGTISIFEAIASKDQDKACELAKEPANLNLKNESGQAPIEAAFEAKLPRVVDCLAKEGALLEGVSFDGKEPIVWAFERHASGKDQTKRIDIFLENIAKNPDSKIEGMPPMFWALKTQRSPVLLKLIELGSDPNQVYGPENNSILQEAILLPDETVDRSKIIGKLISDSRIDLNHKNREGNTVLHLASQKKDHDLVSKLIQFGANKDERNNQNQTAEDLFGFNVLAWDPSEDRDSNLIFKILKSGKSLKRDVYPKKSSHYNENYSKQKCLIVFNLLNSNKREGAELPEVQLKKIKRQANIQIHPDKCEPEIKQMCRDKINLINSCYELLK